MTVLSIPIGSRYLEISGTTSEVKAEMVAQRVTKVEGYYVDGSGNRYILARKE